MDEFEVSVAIRNGCQVVAVCGDLDADTARMLESELDLRERLFDRPALFCPDGSVARVLAIVQAQRLVPIYRDLDAALEGLGAAANGYRPTPAFVLLHLPGGSQLLMRERGCLG